MTQIYVTKFFFDGLDFGIMMADRKLTHGIGGNASGFMVISNLNRPDDEICKIERSANTIYANAGSEISGSLDESGDAARRPLGIEKIAEAYRAASEDKSKYFQVLAMHHDGELHQFILR
jgi:hypothetical protein